MSTLGEMYLEGRDGDISAYQEYLRHGQRVGQAFFNALSPENRARLRGTIHDPFYKETNDAVVQAIEFLLDTEKS